MSKEDRERRRRERDKKLNQRDHSPAPWQEDPYLSSAGGGPYGECGDEDRDR